MATISLRGRKETIEIPNDRATMIKARWIGDGVAKSDPSDLIDLKWITFEYGQIRSIEMQAEKKYAEDFNRPLTPQETADRANWMAKARANLEAKGIIQPRIVNAPTRCADCHCLLKREYACRHNCTACVKV